MSVSQRSCLTPISLNMPANRNMNLLIATVEGDELIIRVPNVYTLKIEMDQLYGRYGGVFAMNMTVFIETHNFVPLFDTTANLLALAKTTRILILIPGNSIIRSMYESPKAGLPLFMYGQELNLMFVRASLILEYRQQSQSK